MRRKEEEGFWLRLSSIPRFMPTVVISSDPRRLPGWLLFGGGGKIINIESFFGYNAAANV